MACGEVRLLVDISDRRGNTLWSPIFLRQLPVRKVDFKFWTADLGTDNLNIILNRCWWKSTQQTDTYKVVFRIFWIIDHRWSSHREIILRDDFLAFKLFQLKLDIILFPLLTKPFSPGPRSVFRIYPQIPCRPPFYPTV